jgi:hypothetical protein
VGALADHIPLYRARPAQHAPRWPRLIVPESIRPSGATRSGRAMMRKSIGPRTLRRMDSGFSLRERLLKPAAKASSVRGPGPPHSAEFRGAFP